MLEQPTDTRRSYRALYTAMFVMFLLLGAQLYNMQIVQGNKYKEEAQGNRERTLQVKANRGIFYDRSGQRLVVNNPSYSIDVTAADVPDVNCAAGSVDTQIRATEVFTELAKTLEASNIPTRYIVAVRPNDLPAERAGEVANRLSVLLQSMADTVRVPLNKIMADTPTSKNLFSLRTDLSLDMARAIQAQSANLPGVEIYSDLQYGFIRGFNTCLKPVTVKRGVDYASMQRVEAAHTNLPGVSVAPEPIRQYADGPLFSHILGYVGQINRDDYEAARDVYEPDDRAGQTGLESALEAQLRGKKGSERVVVNSKERLVTQIDAQPPITGNNVSLTLDANLQKSVMAALQDGITKAKVQAGVAIVMRVDNGQILSMVSLPSYDNNLFSTAISQSDFDRLNNDKTLPMFNRAIGGAYPPGSTYKMITASAALQEEVVKRDTLEYCPGYIEVPFTWNEKQRNSFRDWRIQGHGNINIVQALTVSSDVFFYIMSGPKQEDRKIKQDDGSDKIIYTRFYTPGAQKPTDFNGLGIDRLEKYAQAFGLGKKTGIELPGEVSGLSPNPQWKIKTYPNDYWSLGDTLVTAIGQGYNLMTPLQLVNVTAAIANGGTLYQPQMVMKVTDWSGKVVQDYQPKTLGHVPVSPENLATVREGMRQVIANKEKGTASRMTLHSIQVAGKTGTAEYGEKIGDKDGKEVRRSHAWFTAFAPYDKPEIAVVVLLEGGEQSLEGSTYAVPVTDAILKAYFKVNE